MELRKSCKYIKGNVQVAEITRQNTDELQDGRLLRSSDETSVMGAERRG